MLVYKENESLKNDNCILRDKCLLLENEIHHLQANDPRPFQEEIERINQLVHDKEMMLNREMADQKTEWAEIYGAQKAQFDQQQREIELLTQENVKLRNT